MAAVPPICDFGWKAVDFALEGVDGESYTLERVRLLIQSNSQVWEFL